MALKNYTLLVGRVLEHAFDEDDRPHIELKVEAANGELCRVAINVQSAIQPHALLYRKIEDFSHPLSNEMERLNSGFYDVKNEHPQLALDYVRNSIFTKDSMSIVPFKVAGQNNDLKDFFVPLITKAQSTPGALVYVLGEAWGPEHGRPDKYFKFTPGRGIHDVHMNQGSAPPYMKDNGINQDGAIFFYFPNQDKKWTAIFLAFQSQSWNTDDLGNALSTHTPSTPSETNNDNLLNCKIVAAMVNAPNPEEGKETVTLLNITNGSIDLAGWKIVDKNGNQEILDGKAISAGEALRITLSGKSAKLSNKSGTITLLDKDDLVVDSVSYLKENLVAEGWSVLFK